jgi:predicted Rossmann fold flavoprotein
MKNKESKVKVIVIGGGPAGMIAAGKAATEGADVQLLEKMHRTGRKLMITGKGRCNITNTAVTEEFLRKFSEKSRFMKPSFYSFSNNDVIEFFENMNVPIKEERGGRIFPVSDSARDVVDALVKWCKAQGVKIKSETEVKSLNIQNKLISEVIDSNGKAYGADSFILATGGASYRATGSTGDGYKLAASAGHQLKEIYPALVPLVTTGDTAKQLQGLSLKNVSVSVIIDGRKKIAEFGEMMFAHFGLTGPVILTLSRDIVQFLRDDKSIDVSIDLKPALDHRKLDARLLREFNTHGRQKIKNILKNLLPQRLIQVCLSLNGLDGEKLAHQITGDERKRLRIWLKDFRMHVKGYRPLDEAIVTAGGVSTKEIDSKNMSSKIIKNLFFAGEVIDVDAPTGGYNLQAAFSTGWLAGQNAVKCNITK